MSLLCVHHSLSPSHLFICIATLSPSLKHRVSSHHSPSHLPPYLPPPSSPMLSPSPSTSTSTQPSLTLSAVRSKYQDTGYLTRPWPGSSAPSQVLLADWQRITEAWLMCVVFIQPSFILHNIFIPISSLLFFSLPISLLSNEITQIKYYSKKEKYENVYVPVRHCERLYLLLEMLKWEKQFLLYFKLYYHFKRTHTTHIRTRHTYTHDTHTHSIMQSDQKINCTDKIQTASR